MAVFWQRRGLMALGLGVVAAGVAALASGQARANDAVGTWMPPCPRLASPAGQSYLQPSRLPPAEVRAKTKLGCLSPADAIYGPDGCPLRYCGSEAGAFQLPAAAP